MCRATRLTDKTGKTRALVENRPGRVTLTAPQDRTKEQYSQTAAEILKMFQTHFAKTAKGRKESRKRKRGQSGGSREDAQLPAEPEEKPGRASDDEDVIEDIGAFLSKAEQPEVSLLIKGIKRIALVDTGASKSLCNSVAARRLALEPTGKTVFFRGVGRAEAREMKPVEVIVEGQRALVTFYALTDLPMDFVLSYPDLRKLELSFDTKSQRLVPWASERVDISVKEPVACLQSHLEKANVQQKYATVDHVSGVDESQTDAELIAKSRTLFDEMTTHLDHRPDIREDLWGLLVKYQKCWLRPRSAGVHRMTASFKVRGPPILQKLRHLPPEQKELLETTVNQMLQKGVLRKSKSPWGSRPVFVKKKEGGWRLCLDYRQVNSRMEADAYPLPLLWQNLQKAAGHKWYLCLDCNWGFWNVPIAEESKKYTALVTHMGLYEFNVLPFGIRNSPGEFQRTMDMVLGDLYGRGLFCYIDNIVIYANDEATLLALAEEVFRRCTKEGIYLKLIKSDWCHHEVRLLGHVVGMNGIGPDPRKIEAVIRAKAPENRAELRSFLGLASYLRRFVPHFSTVAAPLVDLTSPKKHFNWSEDCEESFVALKTLMCEQVILTPPAMEGEFIIMTDASDVGIGAVLLQKQGGHHIAILEFASRKFSPAERRWDTREREAFAVRWAVERFHDYVQMGNVTVYTDHESLRWMDNSDKGKVQRWTLFLQQYGVTVKHISGADNAAADWLSRSCDDIDDDAIIEEMSTARAFTAKEGQVTDHSVRVFAPVVPTMAEFKEALLHETPEAYEGTILGPDGLRYHHRTSKLYVPQLLRESVLWWFHASKYGGHTGVNRMIRRMRLWVWWKGYSQDVKAYVGACLVCIRRVLPKQQTLRGLLTRPMPFQLVAIDYVGPRIIAGKTWHYLVLIDHASRFIMAAATESATAAHAREIVETRWCEVFQSPKALLSDRGVFKADLFNDFVTQELGAYHVFSTPYYPQGNAINEACHQGLETGIAASLRETNNIQAALRDAVKVHNAIPHQDTGVSPYFALFGCEPVFPGWQNLSHSVNTPEGKPLLFEKRLRAAALQKLVLDERRHESRVDIKVDDWVVFPLGAYEQGFATHPESSSRNMCPKMSLPAKVVEVNSGTVVVSVLGAPGSKRDVARAICRVLRHDVPPTLAKLAYDMIKWEAPRIPKSIAVRSSLQDGVKRPWGAVIDDARKGTSGDPKRVKRTVFSQDTSVGVPEGTSLN